MRIDRKLLFFSGWTLLASVAMSAGSPARTQSPSAPSTASQKTLLDRYCVTCHNQQIKTAGLTLDTVDLTNVPARAETWEKVVRKLRVGMMPPVGVPRPDRAAIEGFASWLETELDRGAAARLNPGRTEPFHRLNRAEYQNAVRDLLGVDVDLSEFLPNDAASFGFDNIGGVLKMSPALMERYLSTAQRVSRLAVGTPPPIPGFNHYRMKDDLPQFGQADGLPDGTRGGTAVSYFFPMDGEYQFSARLVPARVGDELPTWNTDQPLEIAIDGVQVHVFTMPAGSRGSGDAEGPVSRVNLDADWNVRVPVKAGRRQVTATFLNRTSTLDDSSVREPHQRPFSGRDGTGARLRSLEISGPYNPGGAGETPGRSRIFVCHPTRAAEEAGCAKTILLRLARLGYRRPVTDDDVKPLLSFFQDGRREGGFEAGIEAAVKALLVSPEFLFRAEWDPKGLAPNTAYRLPDLELASRLSFFLWSSIPDDTLLNVAAQGKLKDPQVLEREVRRMLADPRAEALVQNFAGQWLFLRNVPASVPDLWTFPNFDDSLRQAMRRETELFVESVLREDRGALELLTAKYTFVNERLAKHYGIPNVAGSDFRRVELPADSVRGGLLGQGSILTVTSYPTRTSPVIRGAWLLENLLGTPPPPPPPNVPGLPDNKPGSKAATLRERMAQHRANPVCASCHALMEPLGLALENFDAVGQWRDVGEGFSPIDASGALPDGAQFDGVRGLTNALVGRGDRFVATVTEKMLTYALGRGLEAYDAPAVRAIVRNGARTNYRFSSDLVMGIVKSAPFQMRMTAPAVSGN